MAKIYKTALGKQIDVDHLALNNEHIIAVGNMRVNSRGDELGPGGKVVKTRDQIMKEYYALNTPVAVDPVPVPTQPSTPAQQPKAAPAAVQQPQPTLQNIPGLPTEPPKQQAPQPPTPIAADPVVFNPASGLDEEEVEPVINDRQVLHIDTGNATPAEAQKTVEKVVEAITEPAVTVLPAVKEPTQPVNHTNPEIRGSLASSIAKTATVSQVELLPPKKANGVQRF